MLVSGGSNMADHLVHLSLRIPPTLKAKIHQQALKEGHGRGSIVTRMILTKYFLDNGKGKRT
jgi:hypothetical protein